MDWEDKLMAIKSLDWSTHLSMRKPGDWYVSWTPEVSTGCMLEGRYGNGTSPREAVEDHWQKVTNLMPGEKNIVNATSRDKREAFVWSGFMWERVVEDHLRGQEKCKP